jgi:dTMP kinase
MSAGMFIVLEGIDGSGKSVQTRLLCEWIEGLGAEVVETREPTNGEWGRRYRSWARGEIEASADEVLRFFIEDRRDHVEMRIRPALARGAIVVSDRYAGSTVAYQAAHGVDHAKIEEAHQSLDLPEPDLAVWLRLPVEDALERINDRTGERYERREFLERVDAEYARQGLVEVDARGAPEEVAARIRAEVEPVLRRGGLL